MQYSTDVTAHVTKGTSDNQNFNVLQYTWKPVKNLRAEEAPLLQQLLAIPSHPFDQAAADTMVGHLNTFREHFVTHIWATTCWRWNFQVKYQFWQLQML